MSDEFRSPPEVEGKRLDFSQFHPIGDHWPWQCGDLPGGWRTHIKYAWAFRWKQEVHRFTKCKVGWHRKTQYWQPRKKLTGVACIDCAKPFGKKQPY